MQTSPATILTVNSTAQKVTASKQIVRKSFLHASWSEMSLASELSGSDALACESRAASKPIGTGNGKSVLIASLMGVLYSNVANNGGDMCNDIHALSGTVTLPGRLSRSLRISSMVNQSSIRL